MAPGDAGARPARRDAGAHRPGRDRCGDDRAAAGRAGRGVRLARGAVREAGLAHHPPGARPGRRRARRRGAPLRAQAADRRRRRAALQRGHRAAAPLRRGHRDPGRRHPGRQGLHPLGARAGRRRRRVHRLARRERPGPRRGRGAGHRHALQRLHDREQDRLPEPGRAVRQPQRRLPGRVQAVRGSAGRRRPPRAGGADGGPVRPSGGLHLRAAVHPAQSWLERCRR